MLLFPAVTIAAGSEPFYTRNQSPLAQIFGLPPAEGGELAAAGETDLRLLLDVANIFSGDDCAGEEVRLDGEVYRLTLALRRGWGNGFEGGIDLPYVWHRGGRLDPFIDDFHRTFDLPEGGREFTGRNRLRYLAHKDGASGLYLDRPQDGFGDLLLTLSRRLSGSETAMGKRALALRGSLKLPTGRSEELTGSGGTDVALRLAASDDLTFAPWRLGWYGSVGGLLMGDGEVLPDRQRPFAAFGTLGLGWETFSWLRLQIQLDAHSALYRDSELRQLDSESLQVTAGTVLAFPARTSLAIAVTEDLLPNTAPDVVFHLALRQRF